MSQIIPFKDPDAARLQALITLVEFASELDVILQTTIIPAMRHVGHPLAGRVHSLRQEIKLQARAVGVTL